MSNQLRENAIKTLNETEEKFNLRERRVRCFAYSQGGRILGEGLQKLQKIGADLQQLASAEAYLTQGDALAGEALISHPRVYGLGQTLTDLSALGTIGQTLDQLKETLAELSEIVEEAKKDSLLQEQIKATIPGISGFAFGGYGGRYGTHSPQGGRIAQFGQPGIFMNDASQSTAGTNSTEPTADGPQPE